MSRARDFADLAGSADAGGLTGRNLIINGAQTVSQRHGTSAVTSDQYLTDRFTSANNNHSGAWSWQQVTDAPAGFKNSLKFTTTTADATTATNQYSLLRYYTEGNDTAHLDFGSSDAKGITLSFYVKSSLTGTFGGSIGNNAQNRSYPFTYSISSASTWERKTVTLSGDQSGTWETGVSTGLRINFSMGTGTSYQGTAGAWNGDTDFSATGETSVLATLNATWQITGVQLEVGEQATPFEHRSYQDEYLRSARYFYQWKSNSGYHKVGFGRAWSTSNCVAGVFRTPVPMRALPSLTNSGLGDFAVAGVGGTPTAMGIAESSTDFRTFTLNVDQTSAFTAGALYQTETDNVTGAYLRFDAEL